MFCLFGRSHFAPGTTAEINESGIYSKTEYRTSAEWFGTGGLRKARCVVTTV